MSAHYCDHDTPKLAQGFAEKDFLSGRQHPTIEIAKPQNNVTLVVVNVKNRIGKCVEWEKRKVDCINRSGNWIGIDLQH